MTPLCRRVIAPLLAVVLLNISLAQGAKERMHVSQGGVEFNVIRFDDGRTKPFKMTFKLDDDTSTYKFNTDGNVTDINVGGLMYEVGPTSLPDVILSNNQSSLGSTRRLLPEDSEETEKQLFYEYDETSLVERRRLHACGDCEDTWDVMCGQGLQSVCDLVDYGSPFDESGEASISTVCDDFGDACSNLTADLACEGRCEEEDSTDDGACDPNPCNAGKCSIDSAGGHMCSCPDGFGGMSCQTDTSNLDPFYIEIVHNGTWTTAQEEVVRAQADRWEQIITHVPCGGTEVVPAGRLLLIATQRAIDGVGGALGYASPNYVWNDCRGVSFVGTMVFDVDDLAVLNEFELELLYLHEMAHAIGFGPNWEACSTCEDDGDPEWTCPAAAAVYNDLLGASSGSPADIVELENGKGTRCGHWSENVFKDELMTGIGEHGAPEPLSKLTVASLEDIGYTVDPSMVEPYTLPGFRAASTLRLDAFVAREHRDVAFNTTKYVVDKDGNVVKEKHMNASVRF